MHVDEVSGSIVETAIELHRELGPGLIESVYETVLAHQLAARGLRVRSQQPVQLEYEGIVFRKAFRVDLLIEDTVVVEIKSTPKHDPVFERQVLTYLRLMRLPVPGAQLWAPDVDRRRQARSQRRTITPRLTRPRQHITNATDLADTVQSVALLRAPRGPRVNRVDALPRTRALARRAPR